MRNLLVLAIFVLAIAIASPAKAACTDITIGADIITFGAYAENYSDFDGDGEDQVGFHNLMVKIYLFNTYTDNVKTSVRIDANGYAEEDFMNNGFIHDASSNSLSIAYAYITMNEFLTEGLTFEVGKLNHSWQMRKTFGGQSLYYSVPGTMDSAFVFETKPLGWNMVFNFNPDMMISFGWGKIEEASTMGNSDNDLTVYYVRYDQKLGENNKFFVALLFYDDARGAAFPSDIDSLWYFNAGIDFFLMDEALELYIEFSYQGGTIRDGYPDTVEYGSFALDLGAEYTFTDVETVPYIGFEVVYYGGEETGDTYAYVRYNTNFNRTLIIENDFMGLFGTSRTGYYGVMLQGGMKSIADEKFSIDIVIAYFAGVGDDYDDAIGIEFDILGTYWYTEDVTFVAGIGYFAPDEDFAGEDADACYVFIFGCNILF